jgi:tetratricopeptide (TPR) repeat protein
LGKGTLVADVFLSYASQDRSRVAPIVEAIERRGWTVWWDRRIDAGAAYDREIETALDESQCIVVVWTQQSIESDWVRNEAGEGLERGVLVPVCLDTVRVPLAFRRTQSIDLSIHGASIEALIEGIRKYSPVGSRLSANSSPLVGRSTELERIGQGIERARAGTGSLLLLAGEAGVGKTRLTKEAEILAREAGAMVLVGRCQNSDAAPPYQPLIEQIEQARHLVAADALLAALGENAPELARLMPELRRYFPDIPEPPRLPPDQERRYFLNGCSDFIHRASKIQPMVLVYEDLHWAGQSTCTLLRHLAERLANWPLLVIGSYRNTDLDPNAPFSSVLQELVRERLAEQIVLSRLTPEEVSAIFEGRSGQVASQELVDLVYTETEGNAFFVEEVYRHLEESGKLFDSTGNFRSGIELSETDVPSGVRLTIEHRLTKVSDSCRTLLTAAAVAGRQNSYKLLSDVSGLTNEQLLDALDEAEAASLMEDISIGREARYQFVHELIRQTLISTLSLPRRQRLHLAIAEAVERQFEDDLPGMAGEIGFHMYQAGAGADAERSVSYLLTASERALGSAAFEDAMRYLDMAEEAAAPSDKDNRGRILGVRAQALRGAARVDDALDTLGAALQLGEGTASYPDLLFQRGSLLVDLYRGGEALPDLEQVLLIAQNRNNPTLEIEAQRRLSDAHYRLSLDQPEHATLAIDACRRTIDLARKAGDQQTLARALIDSSHFVDYWPEFRPEAARNLAEAMDVAIALTDEDLELDCATMAVRAAIFYPVDIHVDAEDIAARLEARRDPIRLKEHYFWMIAPSRNEGRLERSVEVCERAIELADRLGVPQVQYPTFKAMALIPLGRFDEAWQSIGEEVTGEGYRFARALQRLGFFRFKCQMGALNELFDEAAPLLTESHALNRAWMVELIADDFMSMAAIGGRHREAERVIKSTLDEIEMNGLATAEYALAEGAADKALQSALAYQQETKQRDMMLLCAESSAVVGRCLLALDRHEDAVAELETAVRFCEECGARNILWRLLASRSLAYTAVGEASLAEQDRQTALRIINELAATIPGEALRVSFQSHPLTKSLTAPAGAMHSNQASKTR